MAWFKCGGGGIPAALKSLMNAVLNKKWGTSGTYPPEDWPGTVELMGPLEEKTVSGSVVAFSDGADAVKLKSCAVTIAPNIDGVSSVDVVSAGKNLVNIPGSAEITRNQLISNVVPLLDDFLNGKKGNYTISAKTAETVENANFITIRINYTDGTSSSNVFIYRGSTHESGGIAGTFSISSDSSKTIDGVSFGGNTGTAKCAVSEWQIEANAQATAYEPYVTPTTHTANLGRTIYGGEVDVVNGTGTDEWIEPITFTGAENENWSWGQTRGYYRANITVQNITYNVGSRSECFCNLGTYNASGNDYLAYFIYGNPASAQFFFCPPQGVETLEDFKTWLSNNNLQMTAPKATPEDFTFTPVPIISRLGDNTLWSDGDLSVVYRSSGTQTIITPTLISKTVTANGTYTAAADDADGFSSVVVDVPTGATNIETVLGDNPLIEITGVSGTDVTRTMWTRTAAQDETVVFHPNTQVKTNTGANDGYFKVLKNDVVVVSTYANTSTTTPLSIPDIDLEAGDVLTISAGFDNSHTSCWFDLYSTITILSSGSTPVLSLGNPGPVNEPEQEETDAAPEDPEEIQEETPEEVDQNESNE